MRSVIIFLCFVKLLEMSRISDLCRLCLSNCRQVGILVYADERRDKIRECLSIIVRSLIISHNFNSLIITLQIQDDLRFPLIICNECDGKLNSFYQFRLSSVRAQEEFADIVKTVHYETEYYPHEYYSNTQGYHCSYIDIEPAPDCKLDYLEIFDGVKYPTSSTSPRQLSPVLDQQPQLTPQINHTPICFSENAVDQYTPILPSKTNDSEPKMEHYIEPEYEQLGVVEQFEDDQNSFTYEDFDDNTCQSMPSDRNNVDNAIDQKIEEFIQNKGGKKTNPKICTICNKLFRTNYKLRVHYETHAENNAKFTCEFESCRKAFKSKIGLKEHSAKHSGEFNFECETCQKRFLLKSYFVGHLRIHDKERPRNFACSLCPKTFKSKQNLIDHENHHLGIKFFKCEFCSKAFTTKTHLDHHSRTHNQSEQFLCSICNKFLKSKNYLKIHLKTHFPELKNYTCGYCGKTFIQMSDLKIHSLTHTKEKGFVCET